MSWRLGRRELGVGEEERRWTSRGEMQGGRRRLGRREMREQEKRETESGRWEVGGWTMEVGCAIGKVRARKGVGVVWRGEGGWGGGGSGGG